jgi:predicted Zn-dependent peptidase
VEEFERMASEAVPADELEKARSLAKGRFVLGTESPQGLILFGLRREVLEGEAIEPEKMLAQLDAVTVEDVRRVAQDLIARDKVHLAVIGPFDDDERFVKALG